MALTGLIGEIRRSSFVSKVTGLTGATTLAQVLGAGTLVLLTRLLSPADVGTYQVFLSYSALVGSVALLSYPTVLPHVKEAEYTTLVAALLGLVVIVGIAATITFHFTGIPFAPAIGGQVVASGLSSMSEMANIRRQRVRWLAASRLAFSSGNIIWVATLWLTSNASLAAVVYGQVALALLVGLIYAACTFRGELKRPRWADMKAIFIAKKDCALFYAPSELLGSMTFNLPTVLIERYFGAALAGNYGVIVRFCGAPVTILSSTIAQVYHGSLADAVRNRRADAYDNFLRLRRGLAALGALAAAGIFFVVPPVIALMMGPSWADAGTVARVLSPMYCAMIWISPLVAASFQVFEAQRSLFVLQLAAAAIALTCFTVAGVFGSFWWGIGMYSALITLRYLLFLRKVSVLSKERLAFVSART